MLGVGGSGMLWVHVSPKIMDKPPEDDSMQSVTNGAFVEHSCPSAARAWQTGIGRPGCGSRRPTGLRLAMCDSALVPPRYESRLARV